MNNRPTFKFTHEAHNVQFQTEPTRVSRPSLHYKMSQNLLLVSSDSYMSGEETEEKYITFTCRADW